MVYVDNDPIVLIHARALLASHPAGATDYIDADLRDVGTILAAAARTLDFSQPVAVMLIGVLHCIPDEDYPGQLVGTLMERRRRGVIWRCPIRPPTSTRTRWPPGPR